MTTTTTTSTLVAQLLHLALRITANVGRHLPDMFVAPNSVEYQHCILEDTRELAGILKAHPGIVARVAVEDISHSLLRFLANLEFMDADKAIRTEAGEAVREVLSLVDGTAEGLEGFDADLYPLVAEAVRCLAELNEIPELRMMADWKHGDKAYRSLLAVSEYLFAHPEAEGAEEMVSWLGELLETLVDGPADLFVLVDGEWEERPMGGGYGWGGMRFAVESQFQRFAAEFPC